MADGYIEAPVEVIVEINGSGPQGKTGPRGPQGPPGDMDSSVYDPSGKKKDVFAHEADKNNPHAVTAAQVGALPLAGGTLSGQDLYVGGGYGRFYGYGNSVSIQHWNVPKDNSVFRALSLMNSTVVANKANALKFIDRLSPTNEQTYNIFGEHNNPMGTYTGNSDATLREIDAVPAGKYKFLIMTSGVTFIFVSWEGAFVLHNDSTNVQWIDKSEIQFVPSKGQLKLNTTHSKVNFNNTVYSYHGL